MSVAAKGRRLILHFDLNKTIIMKDAFNKSPTIEITVWRYGYKFLGIKDTFSDCVGKDCDEEGCSR